MRGHSPHHRFKGTFVRLPSPSIPRRIPSALRTSSKRRDQSPKTQPPITAKSDFGLFVWNILFDTTSKDLWGIFNRYGRLLDVYIPTRPGIMKPWGYGFVRFAYEQDAINVIAILNDRWVDGRIINVSWVKHKNKEVGYANLSPNPAGVQLARESSHFVLASKRGNLLYLAAAASDRSRKVHRVISPNLHSSVVDPRAVKHKL
ncbi:uncharacterized protein LOC131228827 [Magnolia sinica]|uniref:uncharacterized protein LOC131228827 n=1 Tax=Magnolia sinica TaxID=86752 RepID=UPI00265B1652|nr:uncharacterized protein LOC131228827 [Magnolia sinica]